MSWTKPILLGSHDIDAPNEWYVQGDTGSGLPFFFNTYLEKIVWSQPHGTSMCNGGLADGELEAPRQCAEFAEVGCEQCPGPDNVYCNACFETAHPYRSRELHAHTWVLFPGNVGQPPDLWPDPVAEKARAARRKETENTANVHWDGPFHRAQAARAPVVKVDFVD